MTDQEKTLVMIETARNLVDMIQRRLNNRIEVLNTLQGSPVESVPDEVKKMREIEAAKIRAVMQEQKDMIEIIKALFPGA